MFPNLVTYHIHRHQPLPPNDALAYQYVLGGNGLFIRAETRFFAATLPVTSCTVRGLEPLRRQFHLKVPRIPGRLLERVLADARQARRPIGDQPSHGLNEVLYQFHHHGQRVQVKKPPQQATGISVVTTDHSTNDNGSILCDLHSHGNMAAFFSQTDDADEQGAKLYAVIGKLDTTPAIRLRVGLYGTWQPLPVTAVFTHSGPFRDLYFKENHT